MAKLKLGAIVDDMPVKLTVELPGCLHRDLLAYARPIAVAKLSIGETRNPDAHVGVQDHADAGHDTNKALDDATTD